MGNKSQNRKSGPKRRRPRVYVMPDSIPDTPTNVARAILNSPPKKDKDWDFLNSESGARR